MVKFMKKEFKLLFFGIENYEHTVCPRSIDPFYILGYPEVTANLYCDFVCTYWEGCVICSIYLR